MRRFKFRVVLFVVCTLAGPAAMARETYVQLSTRLVAQGEQAHAFSPALEAALLRLVNAHRVSMGRKALRAAPDLQAAARAQAIDLMGQGRVGHVSSSGHDFDSRMRALRNGAMVLPAMAENAARVSKAEGDDESLAKNLVAQWLASPPHRHELESQDYVAVATGVVHSNGQVYADQIFVGPEVVTNLQRAVPPAPVPALKAKSGQGLY